VKVVPVDDGDKVRLITSFPLFASDAGEEHKSEDRKDLTSILLAEPSRKRVATIITFSHTSDLYSVEFFVAVADRWISIRPCDCDQISDMHVACSCQDPAGTLPARAEDCSSDHNRKSLT
jgi:hypothetical protein